MTLSKRSHLDWQAYAPSPLQPPASWWVAWADSAQHVSAVLWCRWQAAGCLHRVQQAAALLVCSPACWCAWQARVCSSVNVFEPVMPLLVLPPQGEARLTESWAYLPALRPV